MKRTRLTKFYDHALEIKAQKGSHSLFPNEYFVHTFERGAHVYGCEVSGDYRLRAGDVVIRSSNGKRLWKYFSYPERVGRRR